MNNRKILSFIMFFILLGLFNGGSLNEAKAAEQPGMHVTSIKLPVYRSFEELSDQRIHLAPGYTRYAELSYNDEVTIIGEKDYAAKIRMTDGREGWVHRAYLNSNIRNQTWLVKKGRNLRDTSDGSKPPFDSISKNTKVYVLEVTPDTKYYKIETVDEPKKAGWIYSWYLEKETYMTIKGGSNVIPYEFGKEGTTTNNISIFTPLNTKGNVTANQINQFINYKTNWANTFMTGMGAAYIEAQTKSTLNAVYLLAHSGLETKWGDSQIVKTKKNYYGLNANDIKPLDDAYDYASKRDGIVNGADFINLTYVSRDKLMPNSLDPYQQPTLDNMRFNSNYHQYSTDEAWASKIAQIAKEFTTFTTNAGWKSWGGKWYFYNPDWTLKTGWLQTGGKWYYFDNAGVMKTGWQLVGGKWYFMNPNGDMRTGWLYSGGKWYFLNPSGDMQTGWLYTGGMWYYLNNSGNMQTGWVLVNKKWYYLYSDGHMAANTTIGGYRLGKDGAML
ncbi:glucosaminidase domain-containing protein [Neobacillus sp. WH10]|uniref:glucosaminidase domain-containing protein n=1 Tax=Neobacillus sp. WH10 TaxID=3047873 RepID=UPI0024C134AF|nr:glucosaminidase domain-containing protein [Neobacillus sp. WH10]WHY76930.1 glucosaminidase domain-containing protein [Neobacillus sp. WH10]